MAPESTLGLLLNAPALGAERFDLASESASIEYASKNILPPSPRSAGTAPVSATTWGRATSACLAHPVTTALLSWLLLLLLLILAVIISLLSIYMVVILLTYYYYFCYRVFQRPPDDSWSSGSPF